MDRCAGSFGGRFTVLYVGRLGPEKTSAISPGVSSCSPGSIPARRSKSPGKASEGEWRRLAKELGVADRVHFWGRCPEDLLRLYAACQVFFLPSLKEVLAWSPWKPALRRPVIVTDRSPAGRNWWRTGKADGS